MYCFTHKISILLIFFFFKKKTKKQQHKQQNYGGAGVAGRDSLKKQVHTTVPKSQMNW